jgi:hypothetical protein
MPTAACSLMGSEYLGNGQSVGAGPYTIEIEQNGENFMADITTPAQVGWPAIKI